MSTAMIEPLAGHWPCSNCEYHADSANSVSHSELEVFRRSPRLYYGRFIMAEWPREETDAFDLGTVLHAEALGQPSEHGVIPQSVLSATGARTGAAWKAFEAEHAGKILLKEAEYEPVAGMLDSIRRHPVAARMMGCEGHNEYSIRWRDGITGLTRRARLDRLTGRVIVDLKSCRDASPKAFAQAAANLGYHRQAAWYQDAVRALTDEELPFVFVAVEKQPPYTCEVYELDLQFLENGRNENRSDLLRLADCRKSDVWERQGYGRIVTLSAPAWAFSNDWETT